MSDSLCLYCIMIQHLRKNLPQEHMARLKTLAWMVTAVILAETVNLDHWVPLVVRPDHLLRQAAGIRRRFARFLGNLQHVDPSRLYRPVIQAALSVWAEHSV